ncbi:MAG TPA: phosphoenolpyruvate--protein phosphotransferase, partial [Anaerolineae bacterium]
KRMKQWSTIIRNPTGLHARPAKIFVNAAKPFSSEIRVLHGSKSANAKSLISMLTLGAERGSEITITVNGEDEAAALAALQQLVESGLGEGELLQRVEAAEVPSAAAPAAAQATSPAAAPVVTSGGPPPASLPANLAQGIAASPGVAFGPIFQLKHVAARVAETSAGPAEELARLKGAIAEADQELKVLRDQMKAQGAAGEAEIFNVHRELLDDPELLETAGAQIQNGQSAAKAWQTVTAERAEGLSKLSDPLLAARSADVRDLGERILRLLAGNDEKAGIELPDRPVIVVAHDLTPSDTASLDRGKVLGLCTAAGGPTAHAAIIARALSIPAVVSAGEKVLTLPDGKTIVLNGDTGLVTIDPDAAAVAQAVAAQEARQARRAWAAQAAGDPAITKDGHRVEIVANIGKVADAQRAVASGAEGVGLLRTEFLFLDRKDAPSEEEQFETYRAIVEAMQGRPIIVRTLDIGGDKPLPYIDMPHEANPFLGERGLRLCLNRPELFRQQVRAILRAAAYGPIRIMFPMVADVLEWRAARQLVETEREVLQAPRVDLGIMVEVPSAALMADAFAPEIDFFSIGTNDLTQYTLAMDRQHPVMAAKSDALHPAVLRLIATTVDAAHRAGKWVGVCGELGSDPQAVPILVGLGVDELSVSAPSVPLVKSQVRGLALDAAHELGRQALACATAADVRRLSPAP